MNSTSLWLEPPANHSQLRDCATDWLTLAAISPSVILPFFQNIARAGLCGKMCPAFYQTMGERSTNSSMALPNAGMGGPGGCWTLSISGWPKDASACSLSDVLEATGDVPPRFYLTARACAGILRRAAKRGKELAPQLKAALEAVARTISPPAADSPKSVSKWGVRRLTVREVERLFGFPDDYTLVTYRGKPACDGPRYRVLGNSMAVPVLKWIGQKIQSVDAL